MCCYGEDGVHRVEFVDRRNGWGLTALHIAVFKGSISTGGQWGGHRRADGPRWAVGWAQVFKGSISTGAQQGGHRRAGGFRCSRGALVQGGSRGRGSMGRAGRGGPVGRAGWEFWWGGEARRGIS